MPETVVGLFRTRTEAETAVRELERAGIDSNEIGLVWPGEAKDGNLRAKGSGRRGGFVVGGVPGDPGSVDGRGVSLNVRHDAQVALRIATHVQADDSALRHGPDLDEVAQLVREP